MEERYMGMSEVKGNPKMFWSRQLERWISH